MKKITITLFLILFVTSLTAQVGQSRLLEVKDGQMDKFMSGVAKKTQMYNNSEDSAKFFTFQILTGANATDFIRVRWMESINDLDNPVDADELSYWNKVARPYYTEGAARIWQRNAAVSHVPEDATGNLRRVIYYNYKDSGEQDFWRFRLRQAKARAAMGDDQVNSAMHVMNCASGCDGNWVAIFFTYENFEHQREINTNELPKLVEKYNEMYGGGSYEQDVESVDASLMPNGRRVVHMRVIREATSN